MGLDKTRTKKGEKFIRAENWNGYRIRFVEKEGEWWAAGIDVAKVLEYANPNMAIINHCK